jgi:hypothetical protein
MEHIWLSGNLSDLAFPFLLFRLWKNRLSGTLEIETEAGHVVDFNNGDICVPAQRFSGGDGMFRLKEQMAGRNTGVKHAESLQDLMETGTFTPEEMWDTLRTLTTEDLIPLFDLSDAEYAFNSEHGWDEHEILFYIPVLDLILDGIRRMTNFSLIAQYLPGQEATLKPLFPEHLKRIPWNPPEIYLYHVIKEAQGMENIFASSRLGQKETQKNLYAFFALGVVGLPHTNTKNYESLEISQADIYYLIENFNHIFESIFKYISKEIGPASLNVLEKCLEETKPSLSPLFQNLLFDPDGRIEINSVPITSAGIPGRQLRQILMQDLNEILAAEILAVKKTLGNTHEAVLIKNLGKIIGWN